MFLYNNCLMILHSNQQNQLFLCFPIKFASIFPTGSFLLWNKSLLLFYIALSLINYHFLSLSCNLPDFLGWPISISLKQNTHFPIGWLVSLSKSIFLFYVLYWNTFFPLLFNFIKVCKIINENKDIIDRKIKMILNFKNNRYIWTNFY